MEEKELRELDEQIAVEVMGWTRDGENILGPIYYGKSGSSRRSANTKTGVGMVGVPRYSSSIEAAWIVVEKMREKGHAFHFDTTRGFVHATFDACTSHRAETAPLAICRAALAVVRAQKG